MAQVLGRADAAREERDVRRYAVRARRDRGDVLGRCLRTRAPRSSARTHFETSVFGGFAAGRRLTFTGSYWTSSMTLFAPKTPLADLTAMLDAGTTTSRAPTETALERIAADGGNGGAAFCFVDADGARRQADALDALRRAGTRLSPLAGVPISVKDLFDVQDQPTRAGSRVLADAPPARTDAPAIARLRRAGAVLIGRTNMSEFAFSGLGLNPHYGTPVSPWRRSEQHVTGGSSSGQRLPWPMVWRQRAWAAIRADRCGFLPRSADSRDSNRARDVCRLKALCRCRLHSMWLAPLPRVWPAAR